MDGDQSVLKAKEAVDAAFSLFREFFPHKEVKRVLLEGLEYLEHDQFWKIRIGFDAGGVKISEPSYSTMGILPGNTTREPIREFRDFYLNAHDGSLVRIN